MSNKPELVTPSDLTVVETQLSARQIQQFFEQTPKDKIYSRPGKGGGTWTYVKGSYVKSVLNKLFAYDWSEEITSERVEGDQVIVRLKLTCRVGDRAIIKEQYGRADVKFKKDSKIPLDLGNDFKAAATDALKKCASEIGLFADVYAPDDFVEASVISDDEKKRLEDMEIETAKESLRAAKSIEELRAVFIGLVPKIRNNKSVIASKNTLKRKLMKGAENESNQNSAK